MNKNEGSNCAEKSLNTACQGSISFSEPVRSVTIIYTNATGKLDNVSSTTTQGMEFRVENYCYAPPAPPKLTIIKTLDGQRINNKDQFKISISNGSSTISSFTTEGKKGQISEGTETSGAVSLTQNMSYIITEQVLQKGKERNIGEIIDYNATYTCTNAKTGSTTAMPSSAMTYNSKDNSRSFTLKNAAAKDNITCTITNSDNTPNNYTFAGTVFNDNGGITSSSVNRQNTSSPFTNTSEYFNGIYDRAVESGIDDSRVQIRLTDCGINTIATTSIDTQGNYSFDKPRSSLTVGQTVCLVEVEPDPWSDYSVDTTANQRSVTITDGNYTYDNLDFGEVSANNTALVLKKFQYINNCPSTLNYTSIGDSSNPSTGFSTATIKNIEPRKCIAYRVTATNRGNRDLNDIVISNTLQKKGANDATVTSVLTNPALASADYSSDSPPIGQNGTVKTKTFVLSPRSKRDFYFNTKYGTITNQ